MAASPPWLESRAQPVRVSRGVWQTATIAAHAVYSGSIARDLRAPGDKKPAMKAGFRHYSYQAAKRPRGLDNLYGLGLGALLAFGSHERDTLVLFERLEASSDDIGMMSEQILAARLRLDEAVAFFVVEPLNNTGFCLHFRNP